MIILTFTREQVKPNSMQMVLLTQNILTYSSHFNVTNLSYGLTSKSFGMVKLLFIQFGVEKSVCLPNEQGKIVLINFTHILCKQRNLLLRSIRLFSLWLNFRRFIQNICTPDLLSLSSFYRQFWVQFFWV